MQLFFVENSLQYKVLLKCYFIKSSFLNENEGNGGGVDGYYDIDDGIKY